MRKLVDLSAVPQEQRTITYGGRKYRLNPRGYYDCAKRGRMPLHRQKWVDTNGPIPAGHDIHHRDGNKQNNKPSNLECLPHAEHTRRHAPSIEYPAKFCLHCGEQLVPHVTPKGKRENLGKFVARNFCGQLCANRSTRGARQTADDFAKSPFIVVGERRPGRRNQIVPAPALLIGGAA